MTVSELIEKLKEMPQDARIYAEYEYYYLRDVRINDDGEVVLCG